MRRLHKIMIVVLLTIFFSGIVSSAQSYKTITDKGYSTLNDYYIETDHQKVIVDIYITKWVEKNKESSQERMYIKIRDFISNRVTYSLKDKVDYSSYGALIRGRASCMGYAILAKKFFDKSGIVNYLIHDLKINHLFNLVRLNNAWKDIDITWYDKDQDVMKAWLKKNNLWEAK